MSSQQTSHFPFASLPLLPMSQIVELVGGGFPLTPDSLETFGVSLKIFGRGFPSQCGSRRAGGEVVRTALLDL